jgi:hypothetical protein
VLEGELADGAGTFEDPGRGDVTPISYARSTLIPRLGIAVGLTRHMACEWWLLTATLGLADSLAILDLTAAELRALAVGFPDALVVTSLRDVESGVALGISGGALGLLVAGSVASSTNLAGTFGSACLRSEPAIIAADQDLTVGGVAIVVAELAVDLGGSRGGSRRRKGCRQSC